MALIRLKILAATVLLASASSGYATTVDTLLTSLTLGNSGNAAEIAALEAASGLAAGSLALVDKDNSVAFTALGPTMFQIDLGTSTPGYFLLKFGVGNTGHHTHYFFQNLADLTKIVFTNTQVNGLMEINGNDVGGRLSHYTTAAIGAVPLPAGGFLLVGALGALAGLRRRRKTA